jgi:hypothetical protein
MNNNEHNQKQTTTSRPIAAVVALVGFVAGLARLQQASRPLVDGSRLDLTTLAFTAKALPVLTTSAVPI